MRGQHFFFATRDDLVPGIEYVESGGLPAGRRMVTIGARGPREYDLAE